MATKPVITKPKLSAIDYARAAGLLEVEVAAIRAVVAVESSGQGFLPDGRLILRFEPHVFCELTKGKYNAGHPQVSYEKWQPGNPRNINHSYELLSAAAKLDAKNAGCSASYGMFQIMGFHYATCGCKTFKEFYDKMEEGESAQLDLFCAFIKNYMDGKLLTALQNKDWATFAFRYNGKNYKKNQYDDRLKMFYNRFLRMNN